MKRLTLALMLVFVTTLLALPTLAATRAALIVSLQTHIKGKVWKDQIFAVSLDGKQRVNLTHTATDETDPVVSPDGRRIAFISTREGRNQIYVMAIDGSNPVNVTNDPKDFFDSPAWSPDSQRILYHASMYDFDKSASYGELWVVDANGSERHKLRGAVGQSAIEGSWSPNGNEIVFREDTSDGSALWVMTADGSDALRLTDPANLDGEPVWSPGGGQIAFARGAGEPGIWTMSNDGTNPIRWVTDVDPRNLAWSPDGESLAYIAAPQGRNAIYMLGVGIADDGSDVHVVAPTIRMADLNFVWSPDGKTLLTTSNGDIDHLGQLLLIDPATDTRAVIIGDAYASGAAAWIP
jgi:Tol biopolymer transport system component